MNKYFESFVRCQYGDYIDRDVQNVEEACNKAELYDKIAAILYSISFQGDFNGDRYICTDAYFPEQNHNTEYELLKSFCDQYERDNPDDPVVKLNQSWKEQDQKGKKKNEK